MKGEAINNHNHTTNKTNPLLSTSLLDRKRNQSHRAQTIAILKNKSAGPNIVKMKLQMNSKDIKIRLTKVEPDRHMITMENLFTTLIK